MTAPRVLAIHVRARVELLPSDAGGRAAPVRGSYRPNHNFGDAANPDMAMGFLEFSADDELKPGEAREMSLMLVMLPETRETVAPGRRWRIQEGRQLVGFGTVLEVLASA